MDERCLFCKGRCCRKNSVIVLDTDDFPTRFTYVSHGKRFVKRNSLGDCIVLMDGLCLMYDKRPTVCRNLELGGEYCSAVMKRSVSNDEAY